MIATQTALEAQLRQSIQQRMGEATHALFETGDVTWRRSKDSVAIDVVRLRAELPELAQRYALPKDGSRRFVVNG